MPREGWRAVVGYEGFYEASSAGRVRSVDRCVPTKGAHTNGRRYRGKVLRQAHTTNGYVFVGLYAGNGGRLVLVHKLVAEAFYGERPKGLEINHRDGDRLNNRVENLEYVTSSENKRHAYAHNGRRLTGAVTQDQRGESHPRATLTEEEARFIWENRNEMTRRDIADTIGCHINQVGRIQRGERWTHVTFTPAEES